MKRSVQLRTCIDLQSTSRWGYPLRRGLLGVHGRKIFEGRELGKILPVFRVWYASICIRLSIYSRLLCPYVGPRKKYEVIFRLQLDRSGSILQGIGWGELRRKWARKSWWEMCVIWKAASIMLLLLYGIWLIDVWTVKCLKEGDLLE